MTAPDELERAVERVEGFSLRWEARMGAGAQTGDTIYCVTVNGFDGEAELRVSDLRLLLSERAELLATVERMRGALMAAQSFIADGGLAETDPGASIYRQITAALTTGEANHKDKP